jgi:hypothetical protein
MSFVSNSPKQFIEFNKQLLNAYYALGSYTHFTNEQNKAPSLSNLREQ